MIEIDAMTMTWLHDAVLEAAETERKLPASRRVQTRSNWPEYKPEKFVTYASESTEIHLPKPSSHQIDLFDWLYPKVLSLQTSDRMLVWAVAHSAAFRVRGPQWSKIAKMRSCDRRKVKADYMEALAKLLYICKA